MTLKNTNGVVQIAAPPLLGSCRLTISLMGLFAYFIGIVVSINLGMAIVCLNKRNATVLNITTEVELESNCTIIGGNHTIEPRTIAATCQLESELYLDKPAQGYLLGAFYYGVVCMQLVTGWLCDRYGISKLIMLFGGLGLTITSLLSPVILEFGGVPYFFAARVFQGICNTFLLAPILPLMIGWTTAKEQGFLVGLASSGVGLANSVTYPIAGLLCKYSGWRSIFYFAGIGGAIWTVLGFFLIYDNPISHPRMSVEEKQYLHNYQLSSKSKSQKKQVIPWIKILTSIPVWSIILSNFFCFAVVKGTVLNLPIFIKDVLDFTITENGVFSAMPLVASLLLHLASGPVFDWVRAKNFYSVTIIRKLFHAVGTLLPAAMMFAASQLNPDQKYAIIGLITIGYSLHEVSVMGGYYFAVMDIAPAFVGVIQGINKTVSLAPGFIMPVIISALTPDGTFEEWSHVFLVFGGLYVLTSLVFVVSGSAKLQEWGRIKDKPLNTI